MNEFLSELLIAVVTAAVPVVSAYLVAFINRLRKQAVEQTENTKCQSYITEIANAVAVAVAATSQTYVDALKTSGSFTVEAQKEAAQKALTACVAAISPAAQSFIASAYGDLTEYLTNRIEAEVRKQKLETTLVTSAVATSA